MRYLFVSLFFIIEFSAASTLLVDKPLEYIGKNTVYYIDKDSSKTLFDIMHLDAKAFEKVSTKADSRLFTKDTIWYKFQIQNNTLNPLERYIVFDIPWLDDIEVFILNNGQLQKEVIGNNLFFQQRAIQANLLNVKTQFKTGISNVYIRVKTQDPFVVPISILAEDDIKSKLHDNEMFHLMLYTVISVMVIFNLILYLVIGERPYLYYALFLLAFEFMNAAYNNFTYMYLWSDSPTLQDWVQSTAIYLYSITGLIFAQAFLSLKKLFPKIYRAHKVILALFIAIAIGSVPFGYHYHVMASIVLSIVFSLYTVCIASYSLLHGNNYAKFFLLGTITGMIGTSITALSVMAVLEYHEIFYNAVDYGMMIDSILISVALARKYKTMTDKVERVNHQLFVLNSTLEDKVSERTEQLEQEITKKNLLFKEIFHRVKNNMQIISSLFMLQENQIEDKKAQEIISDNVSRIKVMSILHEKLYQNDNIDKGSFKNYLEDIVPTILQSMSRKPIDYQIKSVPLVISTDDLISFGLILNELVTNSVKYGFEHTQHPQIKVTIEEDKEDIVMTFKDNGKGMDDTKQTGFGSKLVKSLVEYQLSGTLTYVQGDGFECRMQFSKGHLLA